MIPVVQTALTEKSILTSEVACSGSEFSIHLKVWCEMLLKYELCRIWGKNNNIATKTIRCHWTAFFFKIHLFEALVAQCSKPVSSVHRISHQGYWSGLPCPPPGDLPHPGIEPRSLAWQAVSLTPEPPGNPQLLYLTWLCWAFVAAGGV